MKCAAVPHLGRSEKNYLDTKKYYKVLTFPICRKFDPEENSLDIQFCPPCDIADVRISQYLPGFVLVDHVGCWRFGSSHDYFEEDVEIAA
uniref:Uncharacterized protein n=1 Tax=Megaselia scalaris TaxID=36166 RepID=T1GQX2_MEGSC